MGELRQGAVQVADAAVDLDLEVGAFGLQAVDVFVAQGRDVAVLFGAEALQPGLAGVHAETIAAGLGHAVHECAHMVVVVAIVEADAVFDRHGQPAGGPHGGHGVGHPIRVAHQADAEIAALHFVAGAADIEVDLVVAVVFGDAGAGGEGHGVIAPQLQGQGPLRGVKGEVAVGVPPQDRAGDDHLGVEQRAAAELPQEHAEVAVGALHHGCDAERRGGGAGHGRKIAPWHAPRYASLPLAQSPPCPPPPKPAPPASSSS